MINTLTKNERLVLIKVLNNINETKSEKLILNENHLHNKYERQIFIKNYLYWLI